MNLILRPLTLADAPLTTAIRAAAEALEPTKEIYDLDDVIEEFSEDGVNLPDGSVAIELDGVVVGTGLLMISPVTDKWRAYLFGDIDPAFRRRGFGRQLAEALIEKVALLRDREDPRLHIEIKMWVGDSRVSEAALATSLSLRPVRWFFRMDRSLDVPIKDVPAPTGIVIRPYRPADSEGVRAVSNESFSDHWGSVPMDQKRWENSVVGTRAFLPDQSFVAQEQGPGDEAAPGAIVGFSVNNHYTAETQAHGYATGWVGRLGVSRHGRGRGVATALLTASLQAFKDAGYRDAALGVDGDSPTGAGRVYERVGFSIVDRSTVYLLEIPGRPRS